jgi:tight adherence protein B
VASSLRDEQDAAAEVTASVAPARATAKMLAVLPVFGIALGTSMGARPLTFLLRTSLGIVCLAGGLVLALAGVLWVERLADAAEV